MNIHKNARLTPLRREEMAHWVIEGGLSKAQAAQAFGVSAKIVARWVERFRAHGRQGMADRSSRPRKLLSSDCGVRRRTHIKKAKPHCFGRAR